VHQGHVSVYVKNVDLISPRQQYKYKEHEGKKDKNRRTHNDDDDDDDDDDDNNIYCCWVHSG
jgi:hypothetical protein